MEGNVVKEVSHIVSVKHSKDPIVGRVLSLIEFLDDHIDVTAFVTENRNKHDASVRQSRILEAGDLALAILETSEGKLPMKCKDRKLGANGDGWMIKSTESEGLTILPPSNSDKAKIYNGLSLQEFMDTFHKLSMSTTLAHEGRRL